jgi:hypothetical protein
MPSSVITDRKAAVGEEERNRLTPCLSLSVSAALFLSISLLLVATHAWVLRLPYFWDEAGYYIPAARDLLAGSLIPHSTPSNAHPPLVMAWVALAWRVLGQSPVVTRCAMLFLAAFSLTGFFRLAKTVSNDTVAAVSTVLVAIYPLFFAQSSLAQVDLPAAGLTFWALEAYVRQRRTTMVIWFSLAALAKETAILIPVALVAWELVQLGNGPDRFHRALRDVSQERPGSSQILPLLAPVLPLAVWYAYHYAHTGFVFGNPEFFRYNVQGNLSPLRILLALLLRVWQTVGYLNLYLLTLACLLAMRFPAQKIRSTSHSALTKESDGRISVLELSEPPRPRIALPTQFAFLAIALVYLLAMCVLGGAVLARYMLPVVPLFILLCVSTVWRRMRAWKAVLAIVALSFIAGIFVNPPYGFSPEDNLAYSDYIRLHQCAEAFVEARYPHARVLTAWPASDEFSHPYLGYIQKPMPVVQIEDFTAEQLMSVADARSRFDVALVFSTKYQAPRSLFGHWQLWREWKTRYFGYHLDVSPETAASLLGGQLVYVERKGGQWVGVIRLETIQEAAFPDDRLAPTALSMPRANAAQGKS